MPVARVAAGCPIRNRAWIAARHIDACLAAGATDLIYVAGDSTDGTTQALLEALAESKASGRRTGGSCVRLRPDDEGAGWDRIEPRYSMANIAAARNELVEQFLVGNPEATHLWSVDSDILPDHDCLALLLEADKPMVGAVVCNSTAPVYNFMLEWKDDEPWRNGREARVLAYEVPQPVAWVGGCVLYQRRVFEEWGYRYSGHPRAEEIDLVRRLREHMEMPWIHPRARTSHYLRMGEEPVRA